MPITPFRIRRTFPFFVLALSLVAAQSGAQNMVRVADAGFKIKTRNLWKNPGNYYGVDTFYGYRWSGSGKFGEIYNVKYDAVDLGPFGTIPAGSFGDTGARFDYSVNAVVGLQGYAGAFGGDFSADYNANLTYTYPLYVRAGEPVPVTVTYRTNPNAKFNTTSPKYKAGIDLVTGLSARLGGLGKFADATVFDSPNILSGNFPETRTHLIGEEELLQSNIPGLLGQFTPFGMALSAPETPVYGSYRNGGLTLSGSRYSPFVSFDTTLIGLIGTVAGGAGDAIDFTSKDFSIRQPGASLDLSWKVASFGAQQSYGFLQSVTLSDAPTVTLVAGTTVATHTFTKDNESYTYNLRMPAAGQLRLQTQLSHRAKLDNLISTGTSGSLAFTPFALAFKGTVGFGEFSKTYDFSGKVDEQTLASGTGAIQQVAQEITNFNDSDLIATAVNDFTINPFDDSKPSPGASWPGDLDNPLNGQKVPYAQLPAYNKYTAGSGGIDSFPSYNLSLVPQDGPTFTTAFSGISAADQSRMQVVVTQWDGTPIGNLPNNRGSKFEVYQKGPSSINLRVPAAVLRPGRHTLSLVVTSSFQGNLKTLNYDVPIVVRVPVPVFKEQIWNRIDFGASGGGFVINRFAYTTGTGTFFLKVGGALLDTEVVLDESIVLPSKKYIQLGSGGGPIVVDTDANLNYSDEDQLRYYTSGNSIMTFTLSADLIRQLNGGIHTLRLRTKDVKGTVLNQDPASANDTYTLSALPQSSQDIKDTRIYFWSKAPEIASIAYKDSMVVPETPGAVRLTLKGKEFTPTARVDLKVGFSTYSLPIEFKSDTLMYADVTGTALIALQKGGHQGTLTLSTPTMAIPNPTLDTPIYAGGTTSKAITSTPLTPAVDSINPSPVRDQKTTLTVTGSGFAFDGFLSGTSVVSLDGTILPTSGIRFPSSGRGLTSLTVEVPANLLAKAGKKRLQVVNRAANGVDLAGSLDVTVLNAKPILTAGESPAAFVDDRTTPTIDLQGGVFYKGETTAVVGGAAAKADVLDANRVRVSLPVNANQASLKLSVLNPAPGGGQSAEITVALLEANPQNVKVVPGALVYDRALNAYKQSFAVTYVGSRNVGRGAQLRFANLGSGVTLQNASGTANGVPYLTTSLVPRRQVTVVAVFKKTGAANIDSTTQVGFPR